MTPARDFDCCTHPTRIIGVDPGPTPGIVILDLDHGRLVGAHALQCSAELLYTLVHTFNSERYTANDERRTALVAVEKFVVRGRATADQSLTRDQVANLLRIHGPGVAIERSASQVKPWATDTRLEAAGLMAATKGMRHAKDAARHALYAAVYDAGLPDPLSKSFTPTRREDIR